MEFENYVLKALKGDEQAMERLYNATYPKLRAVTISILKNEDDAEDIIQDSYIKAFSNLHQLEDAGKFEAWLCRIASNKCKDYLKKHKPVLFSSMETEDDEPFEWSIEDESSEYNPEDVVITEDTRKQIMELVNSLPDEQRICLVYYAVEEMKISEIADMLEVSESTVKSRLKYAKDKMRIKIEELEKKGIKLRSVSGFALIPFLHYMFATEAKAASAMSFAAVSEAVAAAATTATKANVVKNIIDTTINSIKEVLSRTTKSVKPIATKAVNYIKPVAAKVSAKTKTVASKIANHTITKTAIGTVSKVATPIVAKLIAAPVATKVVAGIVAAGIVISVPVAIHSAVTYNNDEYMEGYADITKSKMVRHECDFCCETKRCYVSYFFGDEDCPLYICKSCVEELYEDFYS